MLDAFRWQLCRGASLEDMQTWLRTSVFPNLTDSKSILIALGGAEIGTDDEKIIDEVICPENARYLEIKIDWRDGDPPGGLQVQLVTPMSVEEQRLLRVRA